MKEAICINVHEVKNKTVPIYEDNRGCIGMVNNTENRKTMI